MEDSKPPARGQLPPLSYAHHHCTAPAPQISEPSGLLTILARTRASLMRSRRGVWV